jgi:sterol desaturase/sphingolipid hydroxylase (fatty acid hydroxylase superfamily)
MNLEGNQFPELFYMLDSRSGQNSMPREDATDKSPGSGVTPPAYRSYAPTGERAALAASPRLFANPVLEKLSRTHHLMPLFVYLPPAMALVWFAQLRLSWLTIAGGAFAGYVFWTLVEYFGHRFVFHLELPGQLGARLHYLAHGVHHDHPDDKLRLVMPPLMSLPIILLAAPVLRLACGADLVLPVFAGFIAGYVGYDMTHYHLHHGRPRTELGRALRRWHLRHHFDDATIGFGVSAPWWDAVFGTIRKRKAG